MENGNTFRRSSFWVGALALLGFFLLALPNSGLLAAPAKRNVSFDHVKTGFPLTGAHVTLPCETCHVQGAFKGTPKKCAACHTQGSRIQTTTVKTPNHIATTQACDQCHTSTASWSVAFFSHVGVTAHRCGQCHSGTIAKGKPPGHMPTSAPCDSCHRTTTWASASFTHVSVAPGSCATCHVQGGSAATFKPSNHIQTNLSCDACHTTGGSFGTSRFTHAATQGIVAGQCGTCHNGSYTQWNALGKSAGHVSTTASCDTCHMGFVSFAGISGSAFNHAGVKSGACTTCHIQGGSAKTFKPADHIPTNLSCDACHATGGTFTTTSFTHSATQGIAAGQCSACHNGSFAKWNALGKASNHIPTNLSCDACHATGGVFKPSRFTHAATQGVMPLQCANCHNGAYTAMNALGKPTGHVVTTASCDACHAGYVSFMVAGSTFNHTGVTPGGCATCHTQGGSATAKPGNHIPTNVACDACHTTGGTFTTSTFTHAATQGVIAGQCGTCHNGSYTQWNALGKTSNHTATTASCDTCHKGYATFAGAAFAHTGVAPGTCNTCHGVTATGKPSGHMVTSRSCDSCHRSTASGGFQMAVTYSHTSPYFTSHNTTANANCVGCHKTSTETIAGVTAYEPPNCYACHVGNFKPGPHKKTVTPATISYTALELRNCAGSCHQYTNNTFTTILKTRTGAHRATSGGF